MRSTSQGYAQPDSVRQKYAGMEGDDATGMSHTLWREYENLSARWTAPDPYGGSMSLASPQSFNRYSYVNNDPVNKVDPAGLMTGADQGWDSVSGGFWGQGFDFGSPPPAIGQSIVVEDMERHDQWVEQDMNGGEYGHDEEEETEENAETEQSTQSNPNPNTRTNGNPADEAVDAQLAAIFTDGTNGIAVGISADDNVLHGDTHYRTAGGLFHTVHVYGDQSGNKIVGVYAPKDFSKIVYEGGKEGIVSATNPKTGEVLGFAHVNVHSQAELDRNTKITNKAGSRYLGQIGGPGAPTAGDRHVHITYYRSAKDRAEARAGKPATERRMGDFGSKDIQHLKDLRDLLRK
jgi:RHS repeat-associated protein